jgi:hypothetical protein
MFECRCGNSLTFAQAMRQHLTGRMHLPLLPRWQLRRRLPAD